MRCPLCLSECYCELVTPVEGTVNERRDKRHWRCRRCGYEEKVRDTGGA